MGLFALLGFAFVPLGSKTGLEHTCAVFHTRPAQDALAGLVNTLSRAKTQLSNLLQPTARQLEPLPLPSATGSAERVRPRVPRLGQ